MTEGVVVATGEKRLTAVRDDRPIRFLVFVFEIG